MAHSLLIIEDDLSFGKSLTEALKRSGFEVTWVRDADSAMSMAGLKSFDLAVVDCMLPKVNGVDLLQKLHKTIGALPVILMSGIYKDKKFIQTSLEKTKAVAFLSKPFQVAELIDLVKDQLEDTTWQEYSFVVPVHQHSSENAQFLVERLSSLTTINGLHLIQLVSEMMRKKVSGSLNLSFPEKNLFAEVVMTEGEVQKILLEDKLSFFGILLVELGFISQEDLDRAVEEPSYKPLGEKLVDLNSLSPHAIKLVQEKQFGVRLSRLVQNYQYQVQFFPGSIAGDQNGFTFKNLVQVSWMMTQSNCPESWLALKYEAFRNAKFEVNGEVERYLVGSIDDISVKNLLSNVKHGKCIKDLSLVYGEKLALSITHFVFSHGMIKFSQIAENQKNTEDLERLRQILKKQESQNLFEILGLNPQAKSLEIHQNFLILAKSFHPDRLSSDSSDEIKSIIKSIFQNVSTAYETLKESDKKKSYIEELRVGQSSDGLRIEQIIEEVQGALEEGRFTAAKEKFNLFGAKERSESRVMILNYWIELCDPKMKIKPALLVSWFDDFQEAVPLEDRHSYIYFFVKGLFHLRMEEPQKAFKYFRHAIVIEPNFKPARIEFIRLKSTVGVSQGDRPTILTQFQGSRKKA